MTFEEPLYLIALLLVPLLLILRKTGVIQELSLTLPTTQLYKQTARSTRITDIPLHLFLLALTCLFFALAKPKYFTTKTLEDPHGTEIILAIDTSISMWFLDDEKELMTVVGHKEINDSIRSIYQDLSRSLKQRITIAKEVLIDFITESAAEKIGIIIFKAQGITLTPPTERKAYLVHLIKELNLNMIAQDGTALGDAIATSTHSFQHSQSKNKIIILITDGNDNQEHLPHNLFTQMESAQIAAQQAIKIYTIGIGGKGRVFAPYQFMSGFEHSYDEYTHSEYFIEYGREQINEVPLRNISDITGGKFYLASSKEELQDIYKDIHTLETPYTQEHTVLKTKEADLFFLVSAFVCIFVGGLLQYTVLRVFP